jgi:hypothetical protein
MLGLQDQDDIPQTISTSYADDEQTGKNSLPNLFFCTILWARVLRVTGLVWSVCCHPELTFVSFLVPISYAVRVCKEFALLGELYLIIK